MYMYMYTYTKHMYMYVHINKYNVHSYYKEVYKDVQYYSVYCQDQRQQPSDEEDESLVF